MHGADARGGHSPLRRVRSLLGWLAPIMLLVVGNSALCLFSLAGTDRWLGLPAQRVVAGAGVVALLVGLTWSGQRDRQRARLRRDLQQATARAAELEDKLDVARAAAAAALDEHLANMMHELGLGENERMSLYWIDLRRQRFVRVARYCHNPKFRYGGVVSIPIESGILGLTLDKGEYRTSFKAVPSQIGWHQEHAIKGNLTSTTRVGALRMRSITYHGFAVTDPTTAQWGAVLIVESLRPTPWRVAELRSVVKVRQEALMRTVLATVNTRSFDDPPAIEG